MRRIDIKREGCRGFGFVLLLAVMIPTVILGCETPGVVDSTLSPDSEPQIVDDDSTAPALIPEPDDVPDVIIEGGVQLVVDAAGRGMVSVECDDECAYSNEEGDDRYWSEPGRTVTVSAIPDDAHSFSRWSCTGVSCPIDTAVNPLQLSLYNEVDLTAIFRRVEDVVLRYGVEVGTPSSGGVAIAGCELDCLYGDTPPHGAPIYILAEAEEGYELEGWLCEGNCVDHDSGRRINSNTPINPIGLSRYYYSKTIIEPVFGTLSADKATATDGNDYVMLELQPVELVRLTSESKQRLELLQSESMKYLQSELMRLKSELEQIPESAEIELMRLISELEQVLESSGIELVESELEQVLESSGIELVRLKEVPESPKIEAGEYRRVNYAVINDASYGDMDTYRRIVQDSVSDWQSLNPWLDFREVESEMDPNLDLLIRFLGRDNHNLPPTHSDGAFCRNGLYEYHPDICPVGSGSYDEILVVARGTALMDEEVNFCKAQGYLPGQPTYMHHVVKHEIGHFLGLGHHWIEGHLMWGHEPPSVSGHFDDLGYSIPDRGWETKLERSVLNVSVSPEELTELSARASFLERILRQNYEVPEDARNVEVERERLAKERAALEQELVQLKIKLNCGEVDSEYVG